jgi:hypothetical protein
MSEQAPSLYRILGEVECRSEPIVDPLHHGRRKGLASYILGMKQFDVVATYVAKKRLARLNVNRRLRRSDLGNY